MITRIYEENPNEREIEKATAILKDGGLAIYPTDTVYAIGCDALNMRAVEKICTMKGINPQKSNLSIICSDLSNITDYAQVSNKAFKLLKKYLPGPYTFILPASGRLPKIYKKRKEVGIRIPDNNIILSLVRNLLIHEKYKNSVDIVIDGGYGGTEASTVISCIDDDNFEVVRQGKGDADIF